jgi:hypothetical protein
MKAPAQRREDTPVDQQTAAAEQGASEDWKGRALSAEARVGLLEDRLGRLAAVVQASVRDLPEFG